MPTTSQYVALGYDELSEIRHDITDIEPLELGRLIRLTRFDCKAERIIHGVSTTFRPHVNCFTDHIQALIRDFIDLYIEDQSPQIQRHVLQAMRQLKEGEPISGPPNPVEIGLSNEAVSTTACDGNATQHPVVPTPEGDDSPSTLSGAGSPSDRSEPSDVHHDAFTLEPYHGITKKVRLGCRSLFGDDDDEDVNEERDDGDDDFVDIDAVSCASDKQSTPGMDSFDPAGSSWSRATSVVDLSDDYMSGHPQASAQVPQLVPETVNQGQDERHASPLDMADLSQVNPPDAMLEEEIPPWNSPYADNWGFNTDEDNAADPGLIESFSDDGDEMDLDSLPGRPMTPAFGPGKDIDGPQRENSIFAPPVSPSPPPATPSMRPAGQISLIIVHDAAETPPQTTVLNGIPTPVTGSFASAVSAHDLNDNEASPAPADRSTGQSHRSPAPEPLYLSRYRTTANVAPEFSPPTSPVRLFSTAESQARVSETRDSPSQSPAASPNREVDSTTPFQRGRRGRSGRQTANNEGQESRSRSPSAVPAQRSNSSEPPTRRRSRRHFPLNREHPNNDAEDVFTGPPIPFPFLHNVPGDDDESVARAISYY